MSKRKLPATATAPNKKARVVQPTIQTFYVQTEDKESLNKPILTFPHNYLNLADLSRLGDGCMNGVARTIQATKLVAIKGLSQEDYEAEANDWTTAKEKMKDEIDGLKRENEDLKKEIDDLKKENEELKTKIAKQPEFVK